MFNHAIINATHVIDMSVLFNSMGTLVNAVDTVVNEMTQFDSCVFNVC
jgi:hypothetical protein